MIKVLHLITDLDTGGAETMLWKLVSTMDRDRFDSVVVCLTAGGGLESRIRESGVRVYTLGVRRGVPDPRAVHRLHRILKKESPHLIQTWLYHADLLGFIAAKLARIPALVWNIRCSDMDMRDYSLLSGLVRTSLARLSSRPDAVIVNSEAGRKVHEHLGYKPRRWVLVPNGFDLAAYRPDPRGGAMLREELGVQDGLPLIGLIARFDPMKDHDTFVNAALFFLREYASAHFVMAGRGVDAHNSALTAAVQGSGFERFFHLLGQRNDVPHLLPGLDIVSSSSAYGEGFPNIIGEGMACGVPCAVTDVGDSAFLVKDTGFVVPPRDPRALADAWQSLFVLGDQGRKDLGLAARKRIESCFSLPLVVKQYEKLYEELIDSRRQ